MFHHWKAVILERFDSCFFPSDERFPSDATVEFVFSSGPERIKGQLTPNQIQAGQRQKENLELNFFFFPSGREYHKNDPAVIVDYNTSDPVVRWDSYENFNQRYQDSLEGNYCY